MVVLTLITSKTDVLGGIRSFVVLTGSMEPVLPVGSIVFTQKNPGYQGDAVVSPIKDDQARYGAGDVIAFDQGGRTVTHRIVGTEDTKDQVNYRTRGDANNTNDGDLVTQQKVIGKQFFSVPYVGKFVVFLKTIPGFVVLIVIPGVLYIGFELWHIKKEIEKQTEKKVLSRMRAEAQ